MSIVLTSCFHYKLTPTEAISSIATENIKKRNTLHVAVLSKGLSTLVHFLGHDQCGTGGHLKKKWGRIQPWSLLDTMLLSFFYKSSLSLPMSPIITFSGWQSSQRGPRRFKHNFTSAPGFSCWLDVVLVHEYNDHLIESLLAQSSYSNPHRPK